MRSLRMTLYVKILIFSFITHIHSQSAVKNIVVEHFSNTLCGICAIQNPAFFAALRQNKDVIHISYHPSSPYSACLFNRQNKDENDTRTRYHDVFGGTPSFIINGTLKGSSSVQSPTVYNEFRGLESTFTLKASILSAGLDSLETIVEVQAINQHDLDTLTLYVPMVEDTVFYTAPNGERTHYNVFRKSFSGPHPIEFLAPKKDGAPFEFSKRIAKSDLWDLKRLYTIAIVSDSDQNIIQVDRSSLYKGNLTLSIEDTENNLVLLYPNPSESIIRLRSAISFIKKRYEIYNLQGQIRYSGKITDENQKIDINDLPLGHYLLKIETNSGFITKAFQKL